MRDIRYIIVHHSASSLTTTRDQINQWHLDKGWAGGCGYHVVVESSGNMVPGRPLDAPGAHVSGHNAFSLGICVVGDNTTMRDRWVKPQIRTLGRLCWFFEALFPKAVILGHRDMPGTATLCPGLDVRELLGLDQEGVVSSVKPA